MLGGDSSVWAGLPKVWCYVLVTVGGSEVLDCFSFIDLHPSWGLRNGGLRSREGERLPSAGLGSSDALGQPEGLADSPGIKDSEGWDGGSDGCWGP